MTEYLSGGGFGIFLTTQPRALERTKSGECHLPALCNGSLNNALFWDGRAATLEEQVTDPIHDLNVTVTHWFRVMVKPAVDAVAAFLNGVRRGARVR